MMLGIEIDGRKATARAGETILDALNRHGVRVPTLCHVKGLGPTGACRMCVVEVEAARALVPSCSTPVVEGMKILTRSSRVLEARRTVVQLLLANHPDDCLYCLRSSRCELQALASELGMSERRLQGSRTSWPRDISSASIQRDANKCILCGRCVRVCEEVQAVSAIDFMGRGSRSYIGTAFDLGLNVSSCVGCGQCLRVCPTGALSERFQVDEVLAAIADPEKFVVVQIAPAVSAALCEELNTRFDKNMVGKIVAALRRVGFDRVLDTSCAALLFSEEQAAELALRIESGGVLPMLTSFCPAWIKFVEMFYPENIPNLSTCKSPQQMLGALVKTVYAESQNLSPENVVSVSITPCTAAKFEATRRELGREGLQDVDFVLTTRELGVLLRRCGLGIKRIEAEAADPLFGERCANGRLLGVSGWIGEIAIRRARSLLAAHGKNEAESTGFAGDRAIEEDVEGFRPGVAAISGLAKARSMLEEINMGRSAVELIEVMACPDGCLVGGGQPAGVEHKVLKKRLESVGEDGWKDTESLRAVDESLEWFDKEFPVKAAGHKSRELLHTHYIKRDVLR